MDTRTLVIWTVPTVLLLILSIRYYNKFLPYRNECQNALARVDSLLLTRNELLTKLRDVVSRYAKHESDVFTGVTAMRAQSRQASATQLYAVQERYPDLKADNRFEQLMMSIESIDSQLDVARIHYNSVVTNYNNLRGIFPNILFAVLLGFRRFKMYHVPEHKTSDVDMSAMP